VPQVIARGHAWSMVHGTSDVCKKVTYVLVTCSGSVNGLRDLSQLRFNGAFQSTREVTGECSGRCLCVGHSLRKACSLHGECWSLHGCSHALNTRVHALATCEHCTTWWRATPASTAVVATAHHHTHAPALSPTRASPSARSPRHAPLRLRCLCDELRVSQTFLDWRCPLHLGQRHRLVVERGGVCPCAALVHTPLGD
jgi:hypothetical protein